MKLTSKALIELVKDWVADVELVENDEPDFKIEDAKSALNLKVREALTPVLEQELKPKHKSEFQGEISSLERKAIAEHFGIDKKLLEGLSHKDMLKLAKDAYTQTLNLDVSGANKKIEEIIAQHTAKEEGWENEKKQLNQQWQTKLTERDVTEGLMKVLEAIPRKGGEISEQAEMLRYKINKDGYEPRYNPEKRSVELYKDNQVALIGDKDKKVLKTEDYAASWAKAAGIFAEGTQHLPPNPLDKGTPASNPALRNDPYAAMKGAFGLDAVA